MIPKEMVTIKVNRDYLTVSVYICPNPDCDYRDFLWKEFKKHLKTHLKKTVQKNLFGEIVEEN